MKHLFYVHSFLTQIVAESIIQSKGLEQGDCLLVFGRGIDPYLTKQDHRTLTPAQEELARVPSYGERFLLFKRYAAVKSVDRLISSFLDGSPFTAYLPSTRNFLMQLVATHPKCDALHFMEEGLMTHSGAYEKPHESRYDGSVWGAVSRLIGYPNHINRTNVVRKCRYREEPRVFAISGQLADSLAEGRVEVLKALVVPAPPDMPDFDGATILVLQPILEKGLSLPGEFDAVLRALCEQVPSARNLLVRFHPDQALKSLYLAALERSGIRYRVIEDRIPVEAILLRSKGLTVCGFTSTVLFHSAAWGHQTYSLLKVLARCMPRTAEYYSQFKLPDVFSRLVTVLD